MELVVNKILDLCFEGKSHLLLDLKLREKVAKTSKPSYLEYIDRALLQLLDIERYSLGNLLLLRAKLQCVTPFNALPIIVVRQFDDFISRCAIHEVRAALDEFYKVCHLFSAFIVDLPQCKLGIKILKLAIEKIRTSEKQLTAIHADICLLSLKSKNLKIALQFLDIDYNEISVEPVTIVSMDAKYMLLFYYYGGIIYAANDNFEKALYYFEVCCSVPSEALSQIMIEAYKKYILISLIVRGRVKPLMKQAQHFEGHYLISKVRKYALLANAFASTSLVLFRDVVSENAAEFRLDTNYGLVKQAGVALVKYKIKRLARTFCIVPMSVFSKLAGIADEQYAEKFILQMIANNEVKAQINKKFGLIEFADPFDKYAPNMFEAISKETDKVIAQINELKLLEAELLINPLTEISMDDIQETLNIIE